MDNEMEYLLMAWKNFSLTVLGLEGVLQGDARIEMKEEGKLSLGTQRKVFNTIEEAWDITSM